MNCDHPAYDTVIHWAFGVVELGFLCKWCNEEHRFQEQHWRGSRAGDLPISWIFTLTTASWFR